MDTIESLKAILLIPRAVRDEETTRILKGVTGRRYATQLRDWLESNPKAFPERVRAEYLDHPQDYGVDVLLTALSSKVRIGFQIKSDNDLAKDNFSQKLKAQLTDAQAYGLNHIVVVLACQATERNKKKYLYIQNVITRWPSASIQIIEPRRAAGLLKAFKRQLPIPESGAVTWPRLFAETGQEELAPLYLDEWPNLAPHERFQEPQQFNEILEMVDRCPVTVLVGPPAVGKTFVALQVLWRAMKKNQGIRWITPALLELTDGPIVGKDRLTEMKQRIDQMTRYLGLVPSRPPLDAHEFIASNLKPNSVVYIEDPFGKSEEDFRHCLNTYEFFNLDQFLSAISETKARRSCHILMTSREGVFEKWEADCERHSAIRSKLKLIRMGKHSYSFEQRLSLATCLLNSRGYRGVENLAIPIAEKTELPYETELVVRRLPPCATEAKAIESVHRLRKELENKFFPEVTAATDAERLFLFLLNCLSTRGHGRNYFHRNYTILFKALALGGKAEPNLDESLNKYRPYVNRLDVLFLGFEKKRKDEFHLEPVHSTVNDVVKKHLRSTAQLFLNATALSLSRASFHKYGGSQRKLIALHLLGYTDILEKNALDALFEILFDDKAFPFFGAQDFLSAWNSFPTALKERTFSYLESRDVPLLGNICSLLPSGHIPAKEAWKFLFLLSNKSLMGAEQLHVFGLPWRYLLENLAKMPKALRQTLNGRATTDPVIFTAALGEMMILNWKETPENWRGAFLNEQTLSNKVAQEIVLIAMGRNWKKLPQSIKTLFRAQSVHENYKIRALAATSALIFHEVSPKDFEPIYMAALQDSDPHVPLYVVGEGLGKEKHDRRFLEALFDKADSVMAACILKRLLREYRETLKIDWMVELARKCMRKGKGFSEAVLAYEYLSVEHTERILPYKVPRRPWREPSVVRLAWLWAYAATEGKRPPISAGDVIRLVKSLDDPYRGFGLLYLSVKANHLPKELQGFLRKVERGGGHDATSIIEGKASREPPKAKTKSRWGFPIHALLRDSAE